MDFFAAIKTCFSKFATFSGCATRSEFWYFILFIIVINNLLIFLFSGNAAILSIWSLIIFIPSLAVSARRLHDTEHSAWWLLLIPTVIGYLLLLYWYVLPSSGPNKYDA
jgi:uncharacterized membrane protein YhaH (DUF805 family)